MKKLFFSRLQSNKGKNKPGEKSQKVVATADDIRKKLESYQRRDGPANFGHAGLYHVNEVDHDDSRKTNRSEAEEDPVSQ